MPINRFQIRNEYCLSDPELYKIAGKDDPEPLLEGVAMSGLVGVLRQLGDLAQFAAEIFHDLHEEVMSTTARGHSLIARVQQLEAEFPSVEKTLLLQTSHTTFLYNSGMDWHPNLRMDQNLITQKDLPRFVRDSYEECRGPPQLFLLDKFDVAGAGASLKRYTDPSFFKEAPSSTSRKSDEQRERRVRKVKKRGPRWRNGDTPVTYPSSHAKLHQLFLEENIEKGDIPEETKRRVKLKNTQYDQNRCSSYMEKILIGDSQQQKAVDENFVDALALTWPSENGCEYGHDTVGIGTISLNESTQTDPNASLLLNNMDILVKSKIGVDDGHNFDGCTSELNNYLDARASTDCEIETTCTSLESVMKDYETSEGKKKLLSNDSQLNDNVVIYEDDSTSFKGRDSSSCSVSVDTLTEITAELDASSDHSKTPVDSHSMTEEISGNELEKHADRSTIVKVKVNESSEIGLSEEYVTEDVDASLQKVFFLNEDSDVIYTNGTKPDMTSRVGERDANQSAPSSNIGQVADGAKETHRGHSSVYPDSYHDLKHAHDGSVDLLLEASIRPNGSPARGDAVDILGTGISLDNPFISDFKHLETVEPIGLTADVKSEKEISYDGTPDCSDPVATVSDLDKSLIQVLRSDATNDHGRDVNHDNEVITPNDIMVKVPPKLPSNSSYVLPDFHHDVAKVEITSVVDGSTQDENFQYDNGTPRLSSSSLNPEEVQQHVSGKNDCHENREGSSLRPTPELEALKCVYSLQDSPENLGSSLCNLSSDSLPKHLQDSGKKSVVDASSTSESNAPNLETTLMKRLNLLDDESAAVELSSQSLDYSQQIQTSHNSNGLPSHSLPLGFSTPQISSLDSPPLPPLPPMQWRMSRFQNSYSATVPQQSSQDEKCGFGEENVSTTTASTCVGSHNVTQLSENGNMEEFRSGEILSSAIPASVRCHIGTQDATSSYVGFSENDTKREDDPSPIPTSVVEEHYCGNSEIVAEAKVDVELSSQDTTNDGGENNADANTMQKKPLRPRNPLIDEVVAIDKSKLRKVERVKSSLESKPGGDLILEQMQLKKVERVKPSVEDLPLERVQLRKAGERVIPEVEQTPDETKSPRVQLRKVPERAHPLLGSKSMDRNSLLEQIRTKSFNLRPAALPRPNLQGPSIQGPRSNLKVAAILEKASNIRQAMAGSDEEDDEDSWSDC